MKVNAILLLIFVNAILGAQVAGDVGICSVCTVAVNTLESFLSKSVSKNDLLNKLNGLCSTAKEFIDEEECRGYVKLYGPYTIDLLLSRAKPDTICSTLRLCPNSEDDGPVYEILFPTFTEKSVVYETEETEQKEEAHYRFFLGNATELLDSQLAQLQVEFTQNFGDLQFDLFYFSEEGEKLVVSSVRCNDGGKCNSDDVPVAWDGLWYYLDVKGPASFHLKVTETGLESPEPLPQPLVIHLNIVNLFLFFSMIVGLCLCCCASLRVCSGRKECRQVHKEIPLEEVYAQVPQVPPMVAYYYPQHPVPYDGQYVIVDSQQFPEEY